MAAKNENLKRGALGPTGKQGVQPGGRGYLAPPPKKGSQAGTPNLEKARKDRQAVRDRVAVNEDASLTEVHKELTRLTRMLLSKAERAKRVPSSGTMDIIREYRQTQERINEQKRLRGQVAEAQDFFAILDQMYCGNVDLSEIDIEAEQYDADLEEIHKDLTSLTRALLRRATREGVEPPRATMDVIREFRQTSEAVSVARRTRSAISQSQPFLATVESRREKTEAALGRDPVPVFSPSS